MSKPRVKYYNRWSELPQGIRKFVKADKGVCDLDTNTVWVKRGAGQQSVRLHEIYHATHRHPHMPKDPVKYIEQEFKADLYAYNKLKQPRRIREHIRSLYIDLDRYGIKHKERLIIIRKAMKQTGCPPSWIKSYDEAKYQIDDIYKQVMAVKRGMKRKAG